MAQQIETLLRGGQVIDPAAGRDGIDRRTTTRRWPAANLSPRLTGSDIH